MFIEKEKKEACQPSPSLLGWCQKRLSGELRLSPLFTGDEATLTMLSVETMSVARTHPSTHYQQGIPHFLWQQKPSGGFEFLIPLSSKEMVPPLSLHEQCQKKKKRIKIEDLTKIQPHNII